MTSSRPGFIYAIVQAQFVLSGAPVVKIGRTEWYEDRMKSYTKGFVPIFLMYCDTPQVTELELIRLFQKRFKARTDIGRESFEGDIGSMVSLLASVVSLKLIGGSFRPTEVKGAFKLPPTPNGDPESVMAPSTCFPMSVTVLSTSVPMPITVPSTSVLGSVTVPSTSGEALANDGHKQCFCEDCGMSFTTRQARYKHKKMNCYVTGVRRNDVTKRLRDDVNVLRAEVQRLMQNKGGISG